MQLRLKKDTTTYMLVPRRPFGQQNPHLEMVIRSSVIDKHVITLSYCFDFIVRIENGSS